MGIFHSLHLRLVASYVLVTLITAAVFGGLAYSLIDSSMEAQETEFLRTNAEAIATQAEPLLGSTAHLPQLAELIRGAAAVTLTRIQILGVDRQILVDSTVSTAGEPRFFLLSPDGSGRFLIPFREGGIPVELQRELDSVGRELRQLSEWQQDWISSPPLIVREQLPWGIRVTFASGGEPLASTITGDSRTVTVAIGNPANPDGYVRVSRDSSFSDQALQTTVAPLLMAAGGAILLAGLVGFLVARKLSAPLRRLSLAAEAMGGGALSARAPVSGRDEIGQLARQFNRMAERLEDTFGDIAAERDALRRFIADASHELRTPLTALRSFLELLSGEAGRKAKTRREFLQESGEQLGKLEWITTNLLDLSRLDSGLTVLETEEFDMQGLLESVATAFIHPAMDKGVELEVDPAAPGQTILADRRLLELALSNLLDNALKFTPRGGRIRLGASEGDEGTRLWVRDTGSGIDPQDLEHIFDRFYRGATASTRGSGLGLAMVKSVAEAHGGTAYAESVPGEGATVTLEIPQSCPG